MMKHGWDNYVKYAWGKNELKPVSKRDHSGSVFGSASMGATIVDSLDTLLIMGLHDEYKLGRDWVANNFTLDNVVSKCFWLAIFLLFNEFTNRYYFYINLLDTVYYTDNKIFHFFNNECVVQYCYIILLLDVKIIKFIKS